jgi:hypothetical protein
MYHIKNENLQYKIYLEVASYGNCILFEKYRISIYKMCTYFLYNLFHTPIIQKHFELQRVIRRLSSI